MSGRIFIIVLLACSINSYAQEQKSDIKKETLNLVVGIKKIVKIDFEADFKNLLKINNVANKLDIRPVYGLNEIIFEGKKPGSTNIIIKDKAGQTRLEYSVVITETDQSKTVKALKELIGNIEGIEIEIRAGWVVVDGEIIVPKDIGRLVLAVEKYQDILVFVEPSPHTLELISRRMQDEIQANGIRDVTVRVVNDTFWLEGVVNDRNNKKKRAENIAAALLPDRIASLAQRTKGVGGSGLQKVLIKNFIEENVKAKDKPLPKLVKIVAQFVELSKDYAKTFGFRWSPTFSGGGGSITLGKSPSGTLSSSSEGSLSAIISNLFPKLAAAKNAGNARILQSGMVIVENEVPATITKNTSIPFSLGTGEFTKGSQAEVQFSISTKPEILKQEKVKLGNLSITISVVTGQTNEGNPLQTTNKVSTSIIVGSGDTAVVGGIFQSQSNTAYDKVPGSSDQGGQAPDFLFNFVRAKDYKTSKSQFVVFVTPKIIESASKNIEEIKRKFRRRSR